MRHANPDAWRHLRHAMDGISCFRSVFRGVVTWLGPQIICLYQFGLSHCNCVQQI